MNKKQEYRQIYRAILDELDIAPKKRAELIRAVIDTIRLTEAEATDTSVNSRYNIARSMTGSIINELYSKKIMSEISDGKEELSLIYKSDIKTDAQTREEAINEYKKIFSSEIEREKIVGTSLYGPHRDDIEILINGKSARHFASQGQQRSVVLSMKLGEGEVNREISGEYPVFLFDDVLSELDDKRKKYVLSGIEERQIIITGCENDPDIKADNIINVSLGEFK